jgi:lysine biosynthesis protein LysW
MKEISMATALCPDCDQKIVIGPKPKKGQWVSCPHCNADLEIISLSPLELDWAQYDDDEELEDDFWEDEEEDDDDWDDEDELDDEAIDWEEEEEDF